MNLFAVICAGIIAGVFMPLFSQLPVLNMVNCIPCGWIWVGGIVAVGLYRWLTEEPVVASEGAILGIFTGIVAAFTTLILAILLHGNTLIGNIPERLMPIFDQVRETFHLTSLKQTTYMFLFLFYLVTFPIISLISGFIGVQLFGKSTSRAAVYRDSSRPLHIE
jgi:hypothetical protein